MVIPWSVCGLLLTITYVDPQIVPDKSDYQNFPLPFNLNPDGFTPQTKQTALSFGSCKLIYNPECPDPDVTFFLYTESHPDIPEYLRIGKYPYDSNLGNTDFDPSKPTKIIIHGYNSDMNLTALVEIRKEYMKTRDYNIIAVDWSPLSQGPCYLGAMFNMRHVANCTAQMINRIRELGSTDIHAIGFSLGAHVTGYVANALRPYKLPRITGLDPALPGFITDKRDDKLDKTDAHFVDVFHTNAFMQGKVEESGHVDFYINGGVIQPGCWAENRFFACNHHRAPLYFAESINTQKGFYGWPCPSYLDYLLGRCPPRDPQIIMGDLVNKSATGVYLVITESVAPFAVGKYIGPAIEIFQRSHAARMQILKSYKKEVLIHYNEDDLLGYDNDDGELLEYNYEFLR